MFRRGEPVIICDFDAPSTAMVACIIGWDAERGVWRARYLGTGRNKVYCWSDRPTRVADFGMTIEADSSCCYRAVRYGRCIATYADGKPRVWQDYGTMQHRWWPARKPAFELLRGWLEREIREIEGVASCL